MLNLIKNSQTNKWIGKKVNFLGDSITYGYGTTTPYHTYLQQIMFLNTVRNYGVSGSTISNVSYGMYSRATSMSTDADLVFVFGGTNDFQQNVPLGSIYTTDASGTKTATTDVTTFYGALNTLCTNLISRYPSKSIVLATPLHREVYSTQPTEYQKNTQGSYMSDYVQAVRDVGSFYSIPVCDLWSMSGLNPNRSELKSLYFTDGVHPKAAGHQVIANKIAAFLNLV